MTVEDGAVREHDRRPVATGAGYRPDIDGLRAVAIVLAVAFHSGLPGLRGIPASTCSSSSRVS